MPTRALDSDAALLSLLTRKLFHSGFNKALVDQKWPAFEEAFCRFEPALVAAFTEEDVSRLRSDVRIVRHRLKIRATINNARHMVAMAEEHGSWRAWLHALRALPYGKRQAALHQALTHCGPNTIFYFLLEAGEASLLDKPAGVK